MIREQLHQIYERYKKTKYTVVVYQSGTQDLYRTMSDLLIYNRRRAEQLAMSREKAAANANKPCPVKQKKREYASR